MRFSPDWSGIADVPDDPDNRALSAVLAVAAAGVGVADSFWPAVPLLAVAIGTTGVGAPVHQAYLHEIVPSSERATVTSFNSLIGSAGRIGGQLGLGYRSHAQSVATACVTGGLAMFLALPPLVAAAPTR